MISTNQFKNGNHIDVDGTVFKILDFQHVKPGKGGALVRTKLRRASDGAVIDRTFRAGEKFRAVRTETRKMQFLYADGGQAHFMDLGSYEQIEIPETTVAGSLQWTRPNDEVEVLFIDEAPVDLQLPSAVDLEVTETEPGTPRFSRLLVPGRLGSTRRRVPVPEGAEVKQEVIEEYIEE